MKIFQFAGGGLRALLAALLLVVASACGDDKNDNKPEGGNGSGNPSTTLTVTPENLTLGAADGASASITVTTDAAWTATSTGEGFTFSPNEGSGNATLLVEAAAANDDSEARQLGQITVTAEGVGTPCTVTVSQEGNSLEPLPDSEVITVDFTLGPGIADPTLPEKSDTPPSERQEFTIEGRVFAIYADAEKYGEYYWHDQTVYPGTHPEPNKALYFCKEGAYIEFPAVDGKTLSKVEYTNSTGAGKDLPTFDITTDQGISLNPETDIAADQSLITFTIPGVALNSRCRLTIVDHENAQPAKLVLTYTVPEL